MEEQAAETQGVRAEDRPKVRVRYGLLLAWILVWFAMTTAVVTMHWFVFEAYVIEGPAMEPTLLPGDRVAVDKRAVGAWLPGRNLAVATWGAPVAGQVVALRSPADEINIVKRVVGGPGDVVAMVNNVLWRNGAPVARERVRCPENSSVAKLDGPLVCFREHIGTRAYLTMMSSDNEMEDVQPFTVPSGRYFVMGDHRDRSNDSRNPMIGAVPVARIEGVVRTIYWSGGRGLHWGRLGRVLP